MGKQFMPDVSPWVPMSDPIHLMVMGKFAEELTECASAVARCMIQGVDECEPSTGRPNREWLQDEIADVLANMRLVRERWNLDWDAVEKRCRFKLEYLRKWHSMDGQSAYQGDAP
jgi:hypothetical protein